MRLKSATVWDRLEKNIGIWASQAQGVAAALAVGSRVRQDPPADEWSDLDIILFLGQPGSWITQSGWLEEIGEPLLVVHTRTANNDPAQQVIFSGGYHVDFVLLPVKAIDWLAEHGTQVEPFSRGARVLADRDGRLTKLFPTDGPDQKVAMNPAPPEQEFLNGIKTFWFLAHSHARLLARGDLWAARNTDFQMKETLSSVLALHAVVVGKRDDAWPQGRYMSRWADSQALKDIPNTFWNYNAMEAWNALSCTQDLFKRLTREICEVLHYTYPDETVLKVDLLIRAMRPS